MQSTFLSDEEINAEEVHELFYQPCFPSFCPENILMDRDGMELGYYRDLCADYGIRSCCDIEDFNSLLQGLGEDAVQTAELFPDEDESITMGGM